MDTELLDKEIVNRSHLVLRVPEYYGVPRSGFAALMSAMNSQGPEFDKEVMRIFESSGYKVERGEEIDSSNSKEIGIIVSEKDKRYLSTQKISELTKTPIPKIKSRKEMLSSSEPVVAKCGMHGGLEIYLLQTYEQKIKFISWMLMGHRMSDLIYLPGNPREKIDSVVQSVMSGKSVSSDMQDESFGKMFWFEEYIETPSEEHTSFRIVADVFGRIHYGAFAHSGNKNGSDILIETDKEILKEDPINLACDPGRPLHILLTHPNSPLFLNSKRIVSNIYQGGHSILLSGQKIHSPSDRQLLKEHYIDPDKTSVPPTLLDYAQRIGIACRYMYPYVGVDFLLSGAGNYYFLEANPNPKLVPEALGLSKHASSNETVLAMMSRVASFTSTL